MSLDISLYLNGECVYNANITHNLNKMAKQVSVDFYRHLWRPEECNVTSASWLVQRLAGGLKDLLTNPEYYKLFNPENGWGNYEGLCDFVYNYIKACNRFPDATVEACR